MKIIKTIQNKGKRVKLHHATSTGNVYMSFSDLYGNRIEHNEFTADSLAVLKLKANRYCASEGLNLITVTHK